MRFRTVLAILGILAVFAGGCGSGESSSVEESSSMSAESEERSSTTSSTVAAIESPTTTRAANGNATPSTAGAPSTTSAAPVPVPSADTAPVIILAGCRVGRVMNVRTAVAGSNAASKWGVVAVEVTRTSPDGTQVTQGLRWLGAAFGAGDEWSGTIEGGAGWANSVTVMATTFTNKTTRQQVSLVGTPC